MRRKGNPNYEKILVQVKGHKVEGYEAERWCKKPEAAKKRTSAKKRTESKTRTRKRMARR